MIYTIAALYQFARFADPDALIPALRAQCEEGQVTGTLLLAEEGINGTIAGPSDGIDRALAAIRALPGCAGIDVKLSMATARPFRRLKVRRKAEIVTMGQSHVDPRQAVGTYVTPAQWNALISDPDVVVIDTRNDYEVEIGSFQGAIDPGTRSFRDFPAWWETNRQRFADKTIAMFCTGGIRCEKASNYLLGQGVEDVRHLRGGILKYLEEIEEADSLWQGACFVFDERVSVEHGLREGPHLMCHGCRRPMQPEDVERAEYEPGVSCHRCFGERSDADRARARERQRQLALTRARASE